MSVAFVPQSARNPKMLVNQETIQKLLDENCHLIQCISEYQSKGKLQECSQYQQVLHRNLVWLATVADSNQPGSQSSMLAGSAPDAKDALPATGRTATPDPTTGMMQQTLKPSIPNLFPSSAPSAPAVQQPVYQQSNPAYTTTVHQQYQLPHQTANVSSSSVVPNAGVPSQPQPPSQHQLPPQPSIAQPMNAPHMSYSMQHQNHPQQSPYTSQPQPPYSSYQQPPTISAAGQAQAPYGHMQPPPPPQQPQQPYQQPAQYPPQGQYNMYPPHQ